MYRKDTTKKVDYNKRYKDTICVILEFIHLIKVETLEKDNMCTKDYTVNQLRAYVARKEEETNPNRQKILNYKNNLWTN